MFRQVLESIEAVAAYTVVWHSQNKNPLSMLLNEVVFELMQKAGSGRAFQAFPPQACRVARQRFFEG